MMKINTVYLGLGSNLSEPRLQVDKAIHSLRKHPIIQVIGISNYYLSAPYGYTAQQDFVNAVIKVETSLSPHQLLDYCQAIERDQQRQRTFKNGPRTIDIDILLFNRQSIHSQRLSIPHPGIEQRSFVLLPLRDVAPNLVSQKQLDAVADQEICELVLAEV